MNRTKKLIKAGSNLKVLLPILYMLVIFLFSSNIHHRHPIIKSLLSNHGLNNLLHIPAYGGLTLLWFWAIHKKKLRSRTKSLFYASAIAFSYGVFEEIHQSFILGRSADVFDIILNIVGITLAVLFVRKITWFFFGLLLNEGIHAPLFLKLLTLTSTLAPYAAEMISGIENLIRSIMSLFLEPNAWGWERNELEKKILSIRSSLRVITRYSIQVTALFVI